MNLRRIFHSVLVRNADNIAWPAGFALAATFGSFAIIPSMVVVIPSALAGGFAGLFAGKASPRIFSTLTRPHRAPRHT